MDSNIEIYNVERLLKLAKSLYKSSKYEEALSIYSQESPLNISSAVHLDNELKFQRRYVEWYLSYGSAFFCDMKLMRKRYVLVIAITL